MLKSLQSDTMKIDEPERRRKSAIAAASPLRDHSSPH
jgi:hypothetical protein